MDGSAQGKPVEGEGQGPGRIPGELVLGRRGKEGKGGSSKGEIASLVRGGRKTGRRGSLKLEESSQGWGDQCPMLLGARLGKRQEKAVHSGI